MEPTTGLEPLTAVNLYPFHSPSVGWETLAFTTNTHWWILTGLTIQDSAIVVKPDLIESLI